MCPSLFGKSCSSFFFSSSWREFLQVSKLSTSDSISFYINEMHTYMHIAIVTAITSYAMRPQFLIGAHQHWQQVESSCTTVSDSRPAGTRYWWLTVVTYFFYQAGRYLYLLSIQCYCSRGHFRSASPRPCRLKLRPYHHEYAWAGLACMCRAHMAAQSMQSRRT